MVLLLEPRLRVGSPELWGPQGAAEVTLAPFSNLNHPPPCSLSIDSISAHLYWPITSKATKNPFTLPSCTAGGGFLHVGTSKRNCWVHV